MHYDRLFRVELSGRAYSRTRCNSSIGIFSRLIQILSHVRRNLWGQRCASVPFRQQLVSQEWRACLCLGEIRSRRRLNSELFSGESRRPGGAQLFCWNVRRDRIFFLGFFLLRRRCVEQSRDLSGVETHRLLVHSLLARTRRDCNLLALSAGLVSRSRRSRDLYGLCVGTWRWLILSRFGLLGKAFNCGGEICGLERLHDYAVGFDASTILRTVGLHASDG